MRNLLKGFGLKQVKREKLSLGSGLRDKERGKTPDVNTLGLQWADLSGHRVLVSTEGLEISISLLQKTPAALPVHLKFFP